MKKAVLAFGFLAIAIATYFAYQFKPVAPQAEYTLRMEQRGLGGRISKEITVARLADGTQVRQTRFLSDGEDPAMQQRVLMYADGRRVKTWDSAKLMATRQTVAHVQANVTPECEAPGFREAGRRVVQRVTIVHLVSERPPFDLWRAVELGCEEVGRGGGMDIRFTGWQAGTPDKALFATQGFAESEPNAAYVAELRAIGARERVVRYAEATLLGIPAESSRRP